MLLRRLNLVVNRALSTSGEVAKAKPFSEIPTVSGLTFIMRNLPGGKYHNKNIKEMHMSFREEFGSIMKVPGLFGNPALVFIYNAEDFEKAFRAEGTWPMRFGQDTLKYYRNTARKDLYAEYGSLGTADGELWQKTRTVVNPIMMQPKMVLPYTRQVDGIAKELVEIMRNLKDDKSEMPANFSDYLNRWSLESIAMIAIEKKLNVLSGKNEDEQAKKLVKVVREFFVRVPEFEGRPSVWKYYETKQFKELLAVYDNMTNIVLSYIDEAMKRFETQTAEEGHEESILRKLLKVNKNVAVITASDLLLAGVDTTASAVAFNLYLLAKNPEKQEKLRSELLSALPEKTSQMTPEKMKNLPYLRAVIKESFRMLPITGGNARIVSRDVVLSGYHVPKDTVVMMSAYNEISNPKLFPQPEKFLPERWLRGSDEAECLKPKESNPFAFLPFGFGVRSCVGKRIADLEMEVVIANVVRNFKLEWNYEDIKIKGLFANLPDSEMRYKITEV